MSDLQALIAQHRAAILARDDAIARQIAAQYQSIWQQIYLHLSHLTGQISSAQATGQEVKVSWLYEQGRMQTFLPQVQREIARFASQTQAIVQSQMFAAAQTGAVDALSLMRGAVPIEATFNRLPVEAIRQAVYNMETDDHLTALFSSFDAQAVAKTKNALISAVALGKNPRDIADDVKTALKVPLSRALTISRTEAISAYRDSAINTYRSNADVVQSWIWSAAPGACPICSDLNGSVHDLSEDMDSHPNCRCSPIPQTVSYDQILAGLDEGEDIAS